MLIKDFWNFQQESFKFIKGTMCEPFLKKLLLTARYLKYYGIIVEWNNWGVSKSAKESQNQNNKNEGELWILSQEEIEKFQKAKKADAINSLSEDYEEFWKVYYPRHKIKVWNHEFLLTLPTNSNCRKYFYFVWYVYIPYLKKYDVRLFYYSQSSWEWKSTPFITTSWKYSKWEIIDWFSYEKWTSVVEELSVFLDKLRKHYRDKYWNSDNFYDWAFERDSKYDLLDMWYYSKYVIKPDITDDELSSWLKVKEKKGEWYYSRYYQQFIHEYAFLGCKSPTLDVKYMGKKLKEINDLDLYFKGLWYPDGLGRNFTNLRKWRKKNHQIIWEVETYKVDVDYWNRMLEIVFARWFDKPDLFWVDNIYVKGIWVNTFWLQEYHINFWILATKPVEYDIQVHENIKIKAGWVIDGYKNYVDIRLQIQNNPLITQFKKQFWNRV